MVWSLGFVGGLRLNSSASVWHGPGAGLFYISGVVTILLPPAGVVPW